MFFCPELSERETEIKTTRGSDAETDTGRCNVLRITILKALASPPRTTYSPESIFQLLK